MRPVPKPDLKFENVLNVRDFGGQYTSGGKTVKPGRLFRGAQISNMNGKDRQSMVDLAIDIVIDFRYKGERVRQATKPGDGFNPEFLVYDPDLDARNENELAPHEQFIRSEIDGRESARNYMLGSYEKRPHLPTFVDLTSRSLKRMASHGETIYVHCAAGKDRTGTFVAIILKALGVSDDDIMADYMRTADVPGLNAIIKMAAKTLEVQFGRPYDREVLYPFFAVEPAYLNRSLTAIGPIDEYLTKTLSFSHKDRDKLIAQYSQ